MLPRTMGLVVAIFVAATIYSQLRLTSDLDALDIASNAAPSIAELAEARAELRGLGRAADGVIAAEDEAALARARSRYRDERRQIDAVLAAYEKLPDYSGEQALFARVPTELKQLDRLVDQPTARPLPTSARAATQQRVDGVIDQLEASLREISDLNRSKLEAGAHAIVTGSRRRNVYAFALDGLAILVAFVSTLLAARTVERFVTTLRRRARELDHLAIQVGHEIATPLMPIRVALRIFEEEGHDDGVRRDALARAERSLVRIEQSIERLTTFAKAAIPSAEPAPRTPLSSPLAAAASRAGIKVDVDPGLHVGCAEPVLHELLADLFGGGLPPGVVALDGIEVQTSARYVRISVRSAPDGDRFSDPFDPQLQNPGSLHPGIDLRLATARRRVEACGGAVGVHNGKRERRLWIALPRA